jgi:type VI secretion system protein ImpM
MHASSGVFGKLPSTGDFVSRGLPPGVRPVLDQWMSAFQRDAGVSDWPEGGLRGLIDTPSGLSLFVAIPSRDSRGREFPICAVVKSTGVGMEVAESWCDQAVKVLHKATDLQSDIDKLCSSIRNIRAPHEDGSDGLPCFWSKGGTPVAMELADARIAALVSFD